MFNVGIHPYKMPDKEPLDGPKIMKVTFTLVYPPELEGPIENTSGKFLPFFNMNLS